MFMKKLLVVVASVALADAAIFAQRSAWAAAIGAEPAR